MVFFLVNILKAVWHDKKYIFWWYILLFGDSWRTELATMNSGKSHLGYRDTGLDLRAETVFNFKPVIYLYIQLNKFKIDKKITSSNCSSSPCPSVGGVVSDMVGRRDMRPQRPFDILWLHTTKNHRDWPEAFFPCEGQGLRLYVSCHLCY